MPDIAELRRYAAIDPDDDTVLLEICMDAAMEWLKNAGVPRMGSNRLYDLAVYMLATHYHEKRGATYEDNRSSVAKANEHIPFGVFSILHQLRYGNEVSGDESGQAETPG